MIAEETAYEYQKTSRQTKDVIALLFWILEDLPEGVSLSESYNTFSIFKGKKRLDFEIEEGE
jgi:hypothetical protein